MSQNACSTPASGRISAGSVAPQTPIESAMDDLKAVQAAVHDRVSNLANQLHKVLSDEPIPPGESTGRDRAASPLLEEIRSQIDVANTTLDLVRSLQRRITL